MMVPGVEMMVRQVSAKSLWLKTWDAVNHVSQSVVSRLCAGCENHMLLVKQPRGKLASKTKTRNLSLSAANHA